MLIEIAKRSKSKKGLPIKAKCFKCSEDFWIKWNQTTNSPSKLHSWEYWTGKKTKDKICGQCLRSLRLNKSKESNWSKIESSKKSHLRSYIARDFI